MSRLTATPWSTASRTSRGTAASPRTAMCSRSPRGSRPGWSTSAASRSRSRETSPPRPPSPIVPPSPGRGGELGWSLLARAGRWRPSPGRRGGDGRGVGGEVFMPLTFAVVARCGAARRGRLSTPHGVVETPAFMPVGTLGAVKGMPPRELAAAGASIMLANLYHLALRPGIETIERLGGLHAFTGWSGPILTDSGGFQVFSLSTLRKVDAGGVTFRSHLDGSPLRFTPEGVVDLQERMGVDVAMVLDECPPWPIDERTAAESWRRTLEWAGRARAAWTGRSGGGLFGIVQGSAFRGLREQAAAQLAELGFDGHAIGGV